MTTQPVPTDPQQPPAAPEIMLSGDLKAAVDIAIIYNKVIYTLTVKSKEKAGDPYGAKVTEAPEAEPAKLTTLAELGVKDGQNWKVALSLPPGLIPTIGGVTFKELQVSFGEGTVDI